MNSISDFYYRYYYIIHSVVLLFVYILNFSYPAYETPSLILKVSVYGGVLYGIVSIIFLRRAMIAHSKRDICKASFTFLISGLFLFANITSEAINN